MDNTTISLQTNLRGLSPAAQAWTIIGTCLILQYSFNFLALMELLPDVAGKSLNGITKNQTFLIPGCLALGFAWFFEGRQGIWRIIRPYAKVPLNPLWWIFAAGILTPLLFCALYFNDLLYGNPVSAHTMDLSNPGLHLQYVPMFVQVAISDELFWIGFVYPRLIHAGLSNLKASMIIGLLWGMDYLPFIYTDFFLSPGLNAASLVFGWFTFAPIYLWLYHKTHSSLIIVFFNVCMQLSFNFIPVLPNATGSNNEVAMANLLSLIVGLLLWYFWPNGKKYDLDFLTTSKNSLFDTDIKISGKNIHAKKNNF